MTLMNNPEESFLISGVGVLVDGLCFLEGALSASVGKFHLNYIRIFIHRLTMYYRYFQIIVNNVILYDLSDTLLFYPLLPSAFIFLPN